MAEVVARAKTMVREEFGGLMEDFVVNCSSALEEKAEPHPKGHREFLTLTVVCSLVVEETSGFGATDRDVGSSIYVTRGMFQLRGGCHTPMPP